VLSAWLCSSSMGASLEYLFFLLFGAALIAITFIDLRHKIIPDVLSLPGIAVGFAFSLLPSSPLSWTDSLIGIVGAGAASCSLWRSLLKR
jgi:leader peptidase (prepilin peptidase) / N-methyltransferase